MAAVTFDSGVLLVSRPSESTRMRRWPSVPAWLTASMTPSFRRVLVASERSSMTAWASARSWVGARGVSTLAVEGHDADVDVVRDGVEEGLGGRLGGADPALRAHAVAGVERDDGGTAYLLGGRDPASSALESSTASPIDTVTSSGSTVDPSGTETSTWMVLSSPGSTCPMERSPSAAWAAGTQHRRAATAPATRSGSRRIRCRPSRRASGRRSRWRAPSSRGTSGAGRSSGAGPWCGPRRRNRRCGRRRRRPGG